MVSNTRTFFPGTALLLLLGLAAGCSGCSGDDGGTGLDPNPNPIPSDTTPTDTTSPPPSGSPDISIIRSTYLGGNGFDHIRDAVVGSDGSVYVTGRTASDNFCPGGGSGVQPTYGGGDFDAFVAKLSNDLTTVHWCSYFGGSGYDVGYGIGLDNAGNVYIAGRTSSTNLQTTANAYDRTYNGGRANDPPYYGGDAFAAKISPDGKTLLFSTYFGGSLDDLARNMTVDPATGSVHLVGRTESSNLPIPAGSIQSSYGGGSHDAWLAKLSPDGSRVVFATYIGGSGDERGEAVALDANGTAYAAGSTESANFPATTSLGNRGGLDVWVAKFAPDGSSFVYSTAVGGSQNDAAEQASLIVDSRGRALLNGFSRSSDLPTTPNAYSRTKNGDIDNIAMVFSPDGRSLEASTYFGGGGTCWETAFGPPAVNQDGNIFVTGGTACDDFPVTSAAFQSQTAGGEEVFLVEFSPDLGEIVFSSYLGGGGRDGGRGLVQGDDGDLFVYGQIGSSTMPALSGAAQTGYGGAIDAFMAVFH